MESSDLTLKLYETCDENYIGKLNIPSHLFKSNRFMDNLCTIVLLDQSGSMGGATFELVQNILPSVFEKLQYSNKIIYLIPFDNISVIYSGSYTSLSKERIFARGETYGSKAIDNVFKLFYEYGIGSFYKDFRILTISDGEGNDINEAIFSSTKLLELFKTNNCRVNSQAIRLYTGDDDPETRGGSAMVQMSTIGKQSVIDINFGDENSIIVDKIFNGFQDDGLDYKLDLVGDKEEKYFFASPWEQASGTIPLHEGENIFWLKKTIIEATKDGDTSTSSPVKLRLGNDKIMNIMISPPEIMYIDTFEETIGEMIEFYFKKLKILKIVNSQDSLKEMDRIINYFTAFESHLGPSSTVFKNTKLSSRYTYIKQKMAKRTTSLSMQLNTIKNDNLVNKLSSKQQAEYLRELKFNDTQNKQLAKRAKNTNLDFDGEVRKEIKAMAQHFHEISDIDGSNHSLSFYSTCTTGDGIRTICDMVNDKSNNALIENIQATDVIKLGNIVGIAVDSEIGTYVDPMTYRGKEVYVGSFVSLSDIIVAIEISHGKNLCCIGDNTKEITNVIPYFEDERILKFLMKYCPKLLEYTASIGMRRIIVEIPYTFEYTILAGVWKLIHCGIKDKSEINILCFTQLLKNYEIVSGNHFNFIMNLLNKQGNVDDEGMSIFLNNNGVTNMTSTGVKLAKDAKNEKDEELIRRINRGLYQYEVYLLLKKTIRKEKQEKNQYIDRLLEELGGIDYIKHGAKGTELFQCEMSPQFHSDYTVNSDKIKEIYDKIFWVDYIAVLTKFYKFASSDNPVHDFKKGNLHEIDDNVFKECLGIQYDLTEFKGFCLVQALGFPTQESRNDKKNQKMKIIDLKHYTKAKEMVKTYVSNAYSAYYIKQRRLKSCEEMDGISTELTNLLVDAPDMTIFKNLLINGIQRGVVTYQMKDPSSCSYPKLKRQLGNPLIEVPLREEKAYLLIFGKDENGEIIWNRGNVLMDMMDYAGVCNTKDPKKWMDAKLIIIKNNAYKYRNSMPNRHGHSNTKVSYWGYGFSSGEKMFLEISDGEKEKYKNLHANCCGFNKIKGYNKRKRMLRKEK